MRHPFQLLTVLLFLISAIATSTADFPFGSDSAPTPKTKEELEKHLLGTTWYFYYHAHHKPHHHAIRFQPSGVLLVMHDTRKWTEDGRTETQTYSVTSPQQITLGTYNWEVTFDDEIEKFSGKCRKLENNRCRGTLTPADDS